MNSTQTTTKYRLLGINDEQNTCCQCGKSGLKRVAWLENLDTQDVAHYGVDCAGMLLYGKKSAGNTKTVRRDGEAISRGLVFLAKGMDEKKVASWVAVKAGWPAAFEMEAVFADMKKSGRMAPGY